MTIIIMIISTLHRKKAKKALWFAETYGLLPKSLVLSEENGQLHTINIITPPKVTIINLFYHSVLQMYVANIISQFICLYC